MASTPLHVVLRPEPEPHSKTGSAFRAYVLDDGKLEPLYLGAETEIDARGRVLAFYPKAEIVVEVAKACCASCAAGNACQGGCGGHGHAHPHGARENPIVPSKGGPVFAVGEDDGSCNLVGCGGPPCEGQAPVPPTALRFEVARPRAGGGYDLVTKHEAALPPELQALYARGACKGEACLPWFRVQPVDPERYRVALEAARKLGPMTNTKKVVGYLREYLLSEDQEVFVCLSLDVHGYVRGIAPIARGARDAVMTPIPDILRIPVTDGAYQFLVAHNHPSGQPKPSKADLEVTKAIKAAADVMGILFIDHLVVASRGHYSFHDQKKL
jgi:hypothetical protein